MSVGLPARALSPLRNGGAVATAPLLQRSLRSLPAIDQPRAGTLTPAAQARGLGRKPATAPLKNPLTVEADMPRAIRPAVSRLHPRSETRRIEAYQEAGSDGDAARLLRIPVITFT